jgi:hypothetical protein
MSNEQQELLDEANNNYLNKCLDKKWMKENVFFDGSSNHHLYLKEEFINKCKTNPEFSEKWGLKIEERELSLEERIRIYALKEGQTYEEFVTNWNTDEQWLEDLSDTTIPTKLITITYNDKTIESYE